MRGATGGPPQGRGKTRHFNPRTPRGVRLDKRHLEPPPELEFQSTRPMRGATRRSPRRDTSPRDFNPRAPCGARRHPQSHPAGSGAISIHAPHAGRDDFSNASQVGGALFQSTRPVRGATFIPATPTPSAVYFNPRAPCGARLPQVETKEVTEYFNPRAPCGARRFVLLSRFRSFIFQSTRPVRGATWVSFGG